jgi:serine phosphatase RsbU (regulator of sigma subunit)
LKACIVTEDIGVAMPRNSSSSENLELGNALTKAETDLDTEAVKAGGSIWEQVVQTHLEDESSEQDSQDDDWLDIQLPVLKVFGFNNTDLNIDEASLAGRFPEALKEEMAMGYYEPVFEVVPQDFATVESFGETWKESLPELVLLSSDCDANTETAFEFLMCWQQDDVLADVPVLFWSSHPVDEEQQSLLLERGFSDCLHGELSPRLFLARLQAAQRQKIVLSKAKTHNQQLNEDLSQFIERNKNVEKELNTTRQLQQSLLPKALPDNNRPKEENDQSKLHFQNEKVRVTGIYIPCDSLGGDLYDLITSKDGSLGVTIADVSGHGVPAAFVTAIYKSSFYRTTRDVDACSDVLFHINNELYHIVKTGEYVTAIYCRLMDDFTRLEYSGAGHPYPMHYKGKDGTLDRLQENGTPLAWIKDMEYPLGSVPLEKGDKLFIFTDGISEIKNPFREFLGEEALEEMFLALANSGSERILDEMLIQLSEYTQGHPLEDDMSLVLIEML